jgi:metal-responsive CopG/Arc/MetJ family transcriptional regulator
MKDKRIFIRVSEDFLERLEYLMRINGFKNLSETIRKIIEKEYRKEKDYESNERV